MSYEVTFTTLQPISAEKIHSIMLAVYASTGDEEWVRNGYSHTILDDHRFSVDAHEFKDVEQALSRAGFAFTHDGPQI